MNRRKGITAQSVAGTPSPTSPENPLDRLGLAELKGLAYDHIRALERVRAALNDINVAIQKREAEPDVAPHE